MAACYNDMSVDVERKTAITKKNTKRMFNDEKIVDITCSGVIVQVSM